MKHPWIAYVIVALLAIGVGIAIAGLPDTTPVAATIDAPTTVVTESTAPETVPDDTVPETTGDDRAPETTDTPETTERPQTTEAPATTEFSSDDSSAPPAPAREDLIVVVANGSGLNGAAALNVDRLQGLGYAGVRPRNGTDVVDFTTVYFAQGFEAGADQLAADLQLLPEFVAPLADAPIVIDLPAGVQLLAYIGIDRAR